ncbi:unnamed protein product [Urochloa humidicola]
MLANRLREATLHILTLRSNTIARLRGPTTLFPAASLAVPLLRRPPPPDAAMVLEATMICVDNSEWMRNRDYCPSRFEAQFHAVAMVCHAKLQVSLLSLSRARVTAAGC